MAGVGDQPLLLLARGGQRRQHGVERLRQAAQLVGPVDHDPGLQLLGGGDVLGRLGERLHGTQGPPGHRDAEQGRDTDPEQGDRQQGPAQLAQAGLQGIQGPGQLHRAGAGRALQLQGHGDHAVRAAVHGDVGEDLGPLASGDLEVGLAHRQLDLVGGMAHQTGLPHDLEQQVIGRERIGPGREPRRQVDDQRRPRCGGPGLGLQGLVEGLALLVGGGPVGHHDDEHHGDGHRAGHEGRQAGPQAHGRPGAHGAHGRRAT